MKSKKLRIDGVTISRPYAVLLLGAQHSLNITVQSEDNEFYGSMSAVILSAFSVEAYLNYIGGKMVFGWEHVERRLSPREKFVFLQDQLEFKVNMGKRPFQTIDDLFKARNKLAHARVEVVHESVDIDWDKYDEYNSWYPKTSVDEICTRERANLFVKDARSVIDRLNRLTLREAKTDLWAAGDAGRFYSNLLT